MWKMKVTQKYTSDYGTDLEESVVFRVVSLAEADAIVDVFKESAIGKISYSITEEQEEEENE